MIDKLNTFPVPAMGLDLVHSIQVAMFISLRDNVAFFKRRRELKWCAFMSPDLPQSLN
jgi:hypothetical protein